MIRNSYDFAQKEYLSTIKERMDNIKKIGEAWVDNINYSSSVLWVRIGKNKVAIYIMGYGFSTLRKGNHKGNLICSVPSALITKNKIIVYDKECLKQSAGLLGKDFHDNVKYSDRWSESNDDGAVASGQGWIKANNHKKEIPVGYLSRYKKRFNKKLTFDFDFNLIDFKPTKKDIRNAEKWLKFKKIRRNNYSRGYYHNKKAEERVNNKIYEIDDVFKLWNVSLRREVISHFGMDSILSTLEWEELDNDVIDGRPYELVKVKIPSKDNSNGFRYGTYLRMKNPSTGETHFEGVPNADRRWNSLDEETVKCALAWRDNDKDMIYEKPIALT